MLVDITTDTLNNIFVDEDNSKTRNEIIPNNRGDIQSIVLYVNEDDSIDLCIWKNIDDDTPCVIPIVDKNLKLSDIIRQEAFTNDCR